jgi:hypothetical protein
MLNRTCGINTDLFATTVLSERRAERRRFVNQRGQNRTVLRRLSAIIMVVVVMLEMPSMRGDDRWAFSS